MNRTSTKTDPRVAGDGHRGDSAFRLEPPRRRIEGSQLAVAVVVIVVSALVAVVGFSRASARSPIVVLATDVERGAVVTTSDLRVTFVASDDPVATVAGDDAAVLVGKVAVVDLPAGTVVAPAFFVDRQVVADGEGVVGMALAPGEYPTGQLAPGDLVDVISTSSASDGSGVLVAGAEVFDVAELGTQGSRFVSLRMPAADAARVAQVAGPGGLRLVLVAGVGS